jgi:cytochrome c oxidase assembly protein subunit 15
MPSPASDRWGHRLAVALCGATLVLLIAGGLVTTTGAALAVPDWPTTFGYNMFLYPWSKMVGGIFYEHSHRLIGAVVGLLTLALALRLWVAEPRRWVRWLGVLAVGLVTVQGVLGGLRVVLLKETLAVVHGSIAPAFFALATVLLVVTSREWTAAAPAALRTPDVLLPWLALLTTGAIYLQIVFGALLTHFGQWFKEHLAGAAVVSFLISALVVRVLRRHAEHPTLVRPVIWLGGLLGFQLLLGLGAYVGPEFSALAVPVAHRITGAVLLSVSLLLTLRTYRAPAVDRDSALLADRLSPKRVAA